MSRKKLSFIEVLTGANSLLDGSLVAEVTAFGKDDFRLTLRSDKHFAQVYLNGDPPEAAWQRCKNKLKRVLEENDEE